MNSDRSIPAPARQGSVILRCGITALLVLFAATLTWSQQAKPVPIPKAELANLRTPPQVVSGQAQVLGKYSAIPTSSPTLRLTIALQPPHMEEEEQFLRDLQDKTSPEFHQFLTQKQWIARFSPSAEDEQAVLDWAKSQGFTVTQRYPNRLLVDVEAPVSVVEAAFGVSINAYSMNGANYFSNDRDPVLPATLSKIVISVQGLNNIQHMNAASHGGTVLPSPDYVPGPVAAAGATTHGDGSKDALKAAMEVSKKKAAEQAKVSGKASRPAMGSNITNGYYDPSDIYTSNAYDYNALQNLGHCCNPLSNSGSSPYQTSIALAAFGDFSNNDITGFHNQYPYLAYNLSRVYIDGTPSCCGDEVTLDTEWSTAMSNSFGSYAYTAHVWVYEGANYNNSTFTDMYNKMLSDGNARVFSTSWSCTEYYGCDSGTMDSRHNIFNEMVGEGWTLMAASGDRGTTDDCTDRNDVAYPASDPDVIGVGGTALYLFSDGTYDEEVAWQGGSYSGACGHNNGGSGGGCSAKYAAPGYQSSPYCGAGSRSVPDISLNAAVGQNYYYNGSLQGVGGTSISSPMLAGFMAQEDSYLLYLGNICWGNNSACAPMGNANYYIYYEGYRAPYAAHYPYYDITSGCNSNDITAAYGLGYYCAGTGYDAVTGWGTPNMLQLAWAFNTYMAGDFGAPSITFTGPTKNYWYNTDQWVSWNIADTSENGRPTNGVSGFSQGWDFDPGDVYSESTPGSGNSFYSGPQYANSTYGYLYVSWIGQGCHTANVRAWDNAGWGSSDNQYGPICYDTIAPSSGDSVSPAPNGNGWDKASVKVTLSASDPGAGSTGSGVKATYYSVDNSSCNSGSLGSCIAYSAPFTVSTQGAHTVYFFAEDKANNFESEHAIAVDIDETAPTTTASFTGTLVSGTTYSTPVKVTLTGSDSLSGVASTKYQLDGGSLVTYSAPFTVSTSGAHKVTFYSTDKAGNTETTKTANFTIKSSTTSTVTSSINPSYVGQSVTFKATVTGTTTDKPTGTVTFKSGSTVLGTKTLASGTASLSVTSLTLGGHVITAVYGGATYFSTSTSPSLTQKVMGKTTTTLAASINPSKWDQSVTFTATVSSPSGTPTGNVTFTDGGTTLATRSLSSGKATLVISTLAVGSHSIKATYAGTTTYLGSASSAVGHTVSKAGTTTTVVSSLNPSTSGTTVKFTATVKSLTAGTPTGTVTFKNNGATLGTATLASGKATFSTSTLTTGTHSITAVYAGNTDYTTSTSAVLKQVVN